MDIELSKKCLIEISEIAEDLLVRENLADIKAGLEKILSIARYTIPESLNKQKS